MVKGCNKYQTCAYNLNTHVYEWEKRWCRWKTKKKFNNLPKRAYPHIAHAKKSSHSLVFVTTTSIKVNWSLLDLWHLIPLMFLLHAMALQATDNKTQIHVFSIHSSLILSSKMLQDVKHRSVLIYSKKQETGCKTTCLINLGSLSTNIIQRRKIDTHSLIKWVMF